MLPKCIEKSASSIHQAYLLGLTWGNMASLCNVFVLSWTQGA